MSAVATLPTASAVDAAWARYSEIAARVVADPSLLCDLDHCRELAIAWEEWRDLFLAWRPK